MSTLDVALEAFRSLPTADRVRLADALAADPPRSSRGDAPRKVGVTAIVRVLRESERRLEDAQRMAHIGYWDRDFATGQMTLSNEACRIFGLPAGEDYMGRPFAEVFHAQPAIVRVLAGAYEMAFLPNRAELRLSVVGGR